MNRIKTVNKTEYTVYEAVKKEMSQQFNEDGKVIPFTVLEIVEDVKIDDLSNYEEIKHVLVVGNAKGKGFAGTVKRWGFRAGPNTHGQIKRRSPGSIGTQGQGRVIPGKKMAGRMGNHKVTTKTKIVGLDKGRNAVRVLGSVPGSKGGKVYLYIENTNEN